MFKVSINNYLSIGSIITTFKYEKYCCKIYLNIQQVASTDSYLKTLQ